MTDEPEVVSEEPEVWGPTKPPRLFLFGRSYRFSRARGVRLRPNGTQIGQRVDKASRRYWRRSLARAFNSVEDGIRRERLAQNEVQRLASNSYEARRMIEKDRLCRQEERKLLMQDEWLKRTTAGEKLRPLGVPPLRTERKAEAKARRKAAKKEIRRLMLAEKMLDAVGTSPSGSTSPSTTDESPAT